MKLICIEYYFKMKPRTLLKLCVWFSTSLHIVGLKWVKKISKGRGAWQITICNMYYANTNKTNNILY